MKTCELCGTRDVGVSTFLAWFVDGGVKPIDRCRDHDACRARVEGSGEEWPLETADEARSRVAVERVGAQEAPQK